MLYITPGATAMLRQGTLVHAPNEAYGRLMGRAFLDQHGHYTVVTGVTYAARLRASPGGFRLSGEEMAQLRRCTLRDFPTDDEIGWTHSHPVVCGYSAEDFKEQATWPYQHNVGVVTFMRGDPTGPFALAYRGPASEPLVLATRSTDEARVARRTDSGSGCLMSTGPTAKLAPSTVGWPEPAHRLLHASAEATAPSIGDRTGRRDRPWAALNPLTQHWSRRAHACLGRSRVLARTKRHLDATLVLVLLLVVPLAPVVVARLWLRVPDRMLPVLAAIVWLAVLASLTWMVGNAQPKAWRRRSSVAHQLTVLAGRVNESERRHRLTEDRLMALERSRRSESRRLGGADADAPCSREGS